eukprot:3816893-Pyramimonas_sp.AAC.1
MAKGFAFGFPYSVDPKGVMITSLTLYRSAAAATAGPSTEVSATMVRASCSSLLAASTANVSQCCSKCRATSARARSWSSTI